MIKFGPAGNDDEFYNSGYKNSEQMPEFLHNKGLDAYEYQCSRGVRVSDEKAAKLKVAAEKYNIALSVHSPYYISLSTQEEEKKISTIKYITDSMAAAKKMGATRVVVHAGSLLGLEREYAVESACKLLKRALEEADKLGLGDITLCPETMGKINQLGDSKEIIQMCKVDDRLIPTIDFGHLYCRSLGKLNTEEAWIEELQMYIDELGFDRMKHFHSHFSQMEYTLNGGEKCHVTLNNGFGPDYACVLKALKELKLEPIIICESAGTQSKDSLTLKMEYLKNEEK
ncbi:MAG: TIM barrel protein [Clostridia bacterium]|nr:TIM barrel protein [Clostridia bacterium]